MDIMAAESMKILAATHLVYITCNHGMVTESGYYPELCNRLRGESPYQVWVPIQEYIKGLSEHPQMII